MPENQSNQLVYDAIKERGRLFLVVFRELSERYGRAEAVSVMRSASYEFGKVIGQALTCYAPRDFAGVVEGYAKTPDDGVTFAPDIRKLDEACLEVQMMKCPIKDAWAEAGCSDEEICTLLHCASALDEATWETAGFDYEIELWSPGKEGCCLTKITEKMLNPPEVSMTIIKHNPEALFPQYNNYSHAVEVSSGSRILFISGLNGYLHDGQTIPESFDEQGDIIWGHIGEILKSANMYYENIVSLRMYLASPQYDQTNMKLRTKYLGDNEPSLTVICCQLLETKWKLEIEAVAAA